MISAKGKRHRLPQIPLLSWDNPLAGHRRNPWWVTIQGKIVSVKSKGYYTKQDFSCDVRRIGLDTGGDEQKTQSTASQTMFRLNT
jgi:hypothetical protein